MTRMQVDNVIERGQASTSLVETLEVEVMHAPPTGSTGTRQTTKASPRSTSKSSIWPGR